MEQIDTAITLDITMSSKYAPEISPEPLSKASNQDIPSRLPRTSQIQEVLSHLSTEINIPWNSRLTVGQGINALTGEAVASAFTPLEPLDSKGDSKLDSSEIIVKSIDKLHELSDDFRIDTSATINLGTPTTTIKAKLDALKTNIFSQRNVIIECRRAGKYISSLHDIKSLELTDDAKGLLQSKDYEKFRYRYGDYFVAGFERHFKFSAIMVCRYVLDCYE
jgi:hypothetical protein